MAGNEEQGGSGCGLLSSSGGKGLGRLSQFIDRLYFLIYESRIRSRHGCEVAVVEE